MHENFLKDEASKLYDGFFSRILNKRPYISLKIACSLDGKIALKNNKSKWITNELSRTYSNFLRSQNDAIMTSSSTILNDNPRMNCRLNGLEKRSPIKIILDRYLKVSSKYKISSLVKHLERLLEEKDFFKPLEKKQSMLLNINNLIYKLQPNDKELRILASIISTLSKKKFKA